MNSMSKRLISLILVVLMLSTNILIGCGSNAAGESQVRYTENYLSVLSGGSSISYSDGPLEEATFGLPRGIFFSGDQLYITDYDTNHIRCLNQTTGVVSTLFDIENPTAIAVFDGTIFVGTDESLYQYQDNEAVDVLEGVELYKDLDSTTYSIGDIEVTPKGFYFTDTSHNCVLYYDKNGDISVVAGDASKTGYKDGNAMQALFREPTGLCSHDGILYISDSGNNCIRAIKKDEVTTVAGIVEAVDETTGRPTGIDGNGFNYPTGLCYYNDMLIVCDSLNNKVKAIDTDGQVIALFGDKAGCTAGTGSDAFMNVPWNVCVGGDYFYLTDSNSNAIREGYLYDTSKNTVETTENYDSVTTRLAAIFELSEEGSFEVVRGNKEMEPYVGMRLAAGDTVTSNEGDLYIKIDEDKIFRLTDHSSITLSEAKKDAIVITLQKGQMFFNIQEKLPDDQTAEFVAGATTMSVRGTAGLFKDNLNASKHEKEEDKNDSEFIRTVTLYLLSGKMGISYGYQYTEEKIINAGQYFDTPEETMSYVEKQSENQTEEQSKELTDDLQEHTEEQQTEEIIEIHDIPQEEIEEVITEVAKEIDENLQQRIINDIKDAGTQITELLENFMKELRERLTQTHTENVKKKENEKKQTNDTYKQPTKKTIIPLNISPSDSMEGNRVVGEVVTLTDFIQDIGLYYKGTREDPNLVVPVTPTDCTYYINGRKLDSTFNFYYDKNNEYMLKVEYGDSVVGEVPLTVQVATLTEIPMELDPDGKEFIGSHINHYMLDNFEYLFNQIGDQIGVCKLKYPGTETEQLVYFNEMEKYITNPENGTDELILLSSNTTIPFSAAYNTRKVILKYNYYGQDLEWSYDIILYEGKIEPRFEDSTVSNLSLTGNGSIVVAGIPTSVWYCDNDGNVRFDLPFAIDSVKLVMNPEEYIVCQSGSQTFQLINNAEISNGMEIIGLGTASGTVNSLNVTARISYCPNGINTLTCEFPIYLIFTHRT